MFGIVGILGCITVVAACVTAAAAIVSTTYSVYNADETADMMDARNLKDENRMKVQQALADRQNQRALVKAAQMAASGSLMDRIRAADLDHKAQNERKMLHRVGTPEGSVPRHERDFGTVARESTTIRI